LAVTVVAKRSLVAIVGAGGGVVDRHVWDDHRVAPPSPLRLDGEDIEIVAVIKERSWRS
jgi:hypothetical protein